MSKIAIFDPNMPKFTEDMVNWWSNQGHQVQRDRYYNPDLVRWADIVWFDTCDNNLKSATYPPNEPGFEGYDMHEMDLSKKKIIVRAIDIEVWYGHHLNADWNLVNDVVFLAPHIQKKVAAEVDLGKVKEHLIHPGVDIKTFNFRNKPRETKVAWVCERWTAKGIDYALQILALSPIRTTKSQCLT